MNSLKDAVTAHNVIINKCQSDPNFLAKIQCSPLETINSISGINLVLNENKSIVVEDQTHSNIVYFNIPSKKLDSVELSDSELEMISGGTFRLLGQAVGSFAADVVDAFMQPHASVLQMESHL